MPAKNAFAPDPVVPSVPAERYVDVDRLVSAEGIVAVFSQRRKDGTITFAMHRTFDKLDDVTNQPVTSKTAFIPETMTAAYLEHTKLAIEHIEQLRAKRQRGELPFPDGGVSDGRNRRMP